MKGDKLNKEKKEWRVESVLGTDDNAAIAKRLEDALNTLDRDGYYLHKFFRNGSHFLLVAYNIDSLPLPECSFDYMDNTGVELEDEQWVYTDLEGNIHYTDAETANIEYRALLEYAEASGLKNPPTPRKISPINTNDVP